MITRLNKIVFILAAFIALSVTSCKKDKFDEPPYKTTDPQIANATIADLRALFTSGNPITVSSDLIISGVVTADDRSGNFYKQFVIQDSTGAIPVLVNKSGLYTDYPVGRKVYIKCKDLVLGQYGKNLQLGSYVDYTGAQPSVGNMPSALADKYIVKGPMVTPIVPKKIRNFSDLNANSDQSLLIELDPVIFTVGGLPYADIINGASASRTIQDCDGSPMEVRTSNFAKFANTNTPATGVLQSIIGIYSIFSSNPNFPPKKQFAIRDISEVKTSSTTCSGVINPTDTVLLSQNFESDSTTSKFTSSGWQIQTTAGTKNWYVSRYSSNYFTQISAYNSGQASNVSWLISPVVNLNNTTNEIFSFTTLDGRVKPGTVLEALISTDYNSGSPASATWTVLPATISNAGTSGGYAPNWTSSGNLDISSYSGNVYVAIRYTGSGTNNLSTVYEVDDIKIVGTK